MIFQDVASDILLKSYTLLIFARVFSSPRWFQKGRYFLPRHVATLIARRRAAVKMALASLLIIASSRRSSEADDRIGTAHGASLIYFRRVVTAIDYRRADI